MTANKDYRQGYLDARGLKMDSDITPMSDDYQLGVSAYRSCKKVQNGITGEDIPETVSHETRFNYKNISR